MLLFTTTEPRTRPVRQGRAECGVSVGESLALQTSSSSMNFLRSANKWLWAEVRLTFVRREAKTLGVVAVFSGAARKEAVRSSNSIVSEPVYDTEWCLCRWQRLRVVVSWGSWTLARAKICFLDPNFQGGNYISLNFRPVFFVLY